MNSRSCGPVDVARRNSINKAEKKEVLATIGITAGPHSGQRLPLHEIERRAAELMLQL